MTIPQTAFITGGIFHIIGAYVSFLVTKVFYQKSRETPKFKHAFYGFGVYTFVFGITGIIFLAGFYNESFNYVTHALRSVAAILIVISLVK